MKNFDAVIFDMDGVIFDSEQATMNCWKEIAQQHGLENAEEVYLATLGHITPVGAALLHSISSLFVIFNSARLVRSGESMQNTESAADKK